MYCNLIFSYIVSFPSLCSIPENQKTTQAEMQVQCRSVGQRVCSQGWRKGKRRVLMLHREVL